MSAAFGPDVAEKLRHRVDPWEIIKRVGVGVYNDGFIHAGNLAYLALLALFPFFIVAAALANLLGQSESGRKAVISILAQLPVNVAEVLREPIAEVLTARTGPLLWVGAIVGLWTVGSFIETIRDILRRAYGVKFCAPFWEYRLGSILMILGAVLLLMLAFAVSAAMTLAHHFIMQWFPLAQNIGHDLGLYRLVPAATLFATFYGLFFALTPARYRGRGCKKWPGAIFITAWWLGTVELIAPALSLFGGYTRTYGSLAGVMVALIFFFVVGLGVVIGAELNAALAESGATALKGEIYTGPYTDELEVAEPEPGEDVEPVLQREGPQL